MATNTEEKKSFLGNLKESVEKRNEERKQNETKTKSKKPLLAIGLTLLAQTLFTLIGFLLLGSVAFFANAVTLFTFANVGVAAGIGIVKGVNYLASKAKNNSNSRSRGLQRNRTLNRENNLETLPTLVEEKENDLVEETEIEIQPTEAKKNVEQPTKGNRRI